MKIGYIRVSTQEQNTMRQEVLMQELGVDEVYIDRLSGKNTDRPELKKMTDYVRKGDTCLLYTSPSPRDLSTSRMPSSA